jgi:hypothetical protein
MQIVQSMSREGAIKISWSETTGIGNISLDGVVFARVEWSEKRGQWCIEDAARQCLRHVGSIKGQAASKEEAVALAEAMVRDGTMPTPEQAHAEHAERERIAGPKREEARERRKAQPAKIRKHEEKARREKEWSDSISAEWEAEQADKEAGPLYEALASAFDFSDAELWRSNSFAMLRPRLVLYVRAAVAKLEHDLAYQRRRSPNPFSGFGASKEHRKAAAERRKAETSKAIGRVEAKLARAREVLALLEGADESAGAERARHDERAGERPRVVVER